VPTIETVARNNLKEQGDGLWKNISRLIKGKDLPAGLKRISLTTGFKSSNFDYPEMVVHLTREIISKEKLRVVLLNKDNSLVVNISAGFISGPNGQQFDLRPTEVYQLRQEIFENLLPVLEKIASLLVETKKENGKENKKSLDRSRSQE
jgi:hypothetical protein